MESLKGTRWPNGNTSIVLDGTPPTGEMEELKQTVWEILMEMKRFSGKAKEAGQRSGGLGSGPSEGLRACQLPSGLGLGDTLRHSKEVLAGAVRSFRAAEEGTVRRMCGRASTDWHGHPARVQVGLLAFAHCVAGCAE